MVLTEPAAVSMLSRMGSRDVVTVAWLLHVLCVSFTIWFVICLQSVQG